MRLVPVLLITSLSAVAAQPAPPAPPAPKPKGFIAKMPQIQTAELANGLRIAFLQLDAAPVVAVQVWSHAGSKDEARDRCAPKRTRR